MEILADLHNKQKNRLLPFSTFSLKIASVAQTTTAMVF